jgi:hypothetical protein
MMPSCGGDLLTGGKIVLTREKRTRTLCHLSEPTHFLTPETNLDLKLLSDSCRHYAEPRRDSIIHVFDMTLNSKGARMHILKKFKVTSGM